MGQVSPQFVMDCFLDWELVQKLLRVQLDLTSNFPFDWYVVLCQFLYYSDHALIQLFQTRGGGRIPTPFSTNKYYHDYVSVNTNHSGSSIFLYLSYSSSKKLLNNYFNYLQRQYSSQLFMIDLVWLSIPPIFQSGSITHIDNHRWSTDVQILMNYLPRIFCLDHLINWMLIDFSPCTFN